MPHEDNVHGSVWTFRVAKRGRRPNHKHRKTGLALRQEALTDHKICQSDQGLETIQIRKFSTDADFAGDRSDARSTLGTLLVLFGPHTCLSPLSGKSKKQTAVSHRMVNAKLASCDHGLRASGLPALTLWEILFERKPTLTLYHDNPATMRILDTSKAPYAPTHRENSPSERLMASRTNPVTTCCLARLQDGGDSSGHLHKAFHEPDKWRHACALIGIGPEQCWESLVKKSKLPFIVPHAYRAAPSLHCCCCLPAGCDDFFSLSIYMHVSLLRDGAGKDKLI
jgi:hypothetical protein